MGQQPFAFEAVVFRRYRSVVGLKSISIAYSFKDEALTTLCFIATVTLYIHCTFQLQNVQTSLAIRLQETFANKLPGKKQQVTP
jgi:hypothetical protein